MSHEIPAHIPELDARLAALPREQAPARDLWPGIAAALAAGDAAVPRRRWPLALAAGLASAAVAGLIGWQAGRESPVTVATLPAAETRAEMLRRANFAVPAGGDYLATRAELEQAYRERLALLAPATRARIEQDLTAVREANADIRSALAADPQSAVLNRLLESTWQQEFDLYATVTRNTDPAARRTRT